MGKFKLKEVYQPYTELEIADIFGMSKTNFFIVVSKSVERSTNSQTYTLMSIKNLSTGNILRVKYNMYNLHSATYYIL